MIEKQFFLVNIINEKEIIKFFKNKFNILLESMNYKKHDSDYFLQYINYSGDIQVGINISCSDNNKINYTDYTIALALAIYFKTEVVFCIDKIVGKGEWILVNSNQNSYFVNISDENDKINIDRKSLVPYNIKGK
jgi:hypothetical protein